MSDPNDPTTPAPVPAPSTGSKIITAVVNEVKLVVALAASPGGLSVATAALGITNPAILLLEQFGVRVLGPLIATWTAPTITETDVTADLAAKGAKVIPFDPMAAFAQ